jgi:hypothetical protein
MPAPRSAPRILLVLALALLVLGVTGCGQGSSIGSPTLPLVPGAHVVEQSRRCDTGHHVYCGLYMVVYGSRYRGSEALMSAERRHLRSLSWSTEQGDIGQEQSAVSPDRRYRLTYATAQGELRAIDLGWVKRPSSISLALAHAMFQGTAALEVTVAAGPS